VHRDTDGHHSAIPYASSRDPSTSVETDAWKRHLYLDSSQPFLPKMDYRKFLYSLSFQCSLYHQLGQNLFLSMFFQHQYMTCRWKRITTTRPLLWTDGHTWVGDVLLPRYQPVSYNYYCDTPNEKPRMEFLSLDEDFRLLVLSDLPAHQTKYEVEDKWAKLTSNLNFPQTKMPFLHELYQESTTFYLNGEKSLTHNCDTASYHFQKDTFKSALIWDIDGTKHVILGGERLLAFREEGDTCTTIYIETARRINLYQEWFFDMVIWKDTLVVASEEKIRFFDKNFLCRVYEGGLRYPNHMGVSDDLLVISNSDSIRIYDQPFGQPVVRRDFKNLMMVCLPEYILVTDPERRQWEISIYKIFRDPWRIEVVRVINRNVPFGSGRACLMGPNRLALSLGEFIQIIDTSSWETIRWLWGHR
jgi:hypothetical protein